MINLNATSLSEKSNPLAATPSVIGFIASESSFHIYYEKMAATFAQRMQETGWLTEIAIHNEQLETLQGIVDQMLRRNMRAFLINPLSGADIRPLVDDLRARGAVVQLIGRWIDYPDCDFIGPDNEQIGYLATHHLIELGHAQIVYVGGAAYSTSYRRVSGYIKAMNEAGLKPRIFNIHDHRDTLIPPEFQSYLDPENTSAALWREMVRHRVTAAFCFSYSDATWVYNQIRKFHLLVPRDISLITVDSPPSAGYMGATLATFTQPGEEMGRLAADLLLRRLAGENFPPQTILLPGQLVLHSSTNAPRDWRAARG